VINSPNDDGNPLDADRVVVIADRFSQGALTDTLRRRYPAWEVAACDSYLAGIAEVSQRPARAVIAWVDPSLGQLSNAVAGLRRAAGEQTRLVLCCVPETEPKARATVAFGADDYVIHPPEGEELDVALGYPRLNQLTTMASQAPSGASLEELSQLDDALAVVGTRPMPVLEQLARLVRTGMRARGVTVIVEGAAATDGDPVTKPVLTAPLTDDQGVIGQLTVGDRPENPYTPKEVEKLTRYASIATHLLRVASNLRAARRLAETDECSGLPNRRHLHARLDAILVRAAAERFPVTLLMFDLDDFKSYNDTFGHDAGDEILRITGNLFREHCREQDVVARYGGDEFAVVFWDPDGPRGSGSSHPDCALSVLDRFMESLRAQHFSKLGPAASGRLTISGGLATYPWDSKTRDALIKRADEALLRAKRAGKNRVFLIGECAHQERSPD